MMHEKSQHPKHIKSEVIFYIHDVQKKLKVNGQVNVTKELIDKIESILGVGNVKFY